MRARTILSVLLVGLPAPITAQEKKPAFTPVQMAERMLYRRAVEAVIWGMPAVNYDLMYQAMIRDAKGGIN